MVENAENDAPFETVTKIQAAERQLRLAIRLFFERRDLIAVHTLGAAAQQVLQDLGLPRGIKGIKEADFIRPERKKEVTNLFNEAQNFFKHADLDPDKQLKFYYRTTPFYLVDAAILYMQLTRQSFPEIAGLLAWAVIKYPDIVAEGPLKESIARFKLQRINPDDFEVILTAINMFAEQEER